MDIDVDFVPKPGDRTKYQYPSGRLCACVWVVCPECKEGRWLSEYQTHKLRFSGRCKKCSIALAKTRGW